MTETVSTEIVQYALEPLEERIKYADVLASANLIPRALWTQNSHDAEGRLVPSRPSRGNVFLVIEHGAMLNLHPMAAINGIYIIEGKASMSANLMSAVVRSKGFKLRVTTSGTWGKDGDFKATAVLIRPDDPDFEFTVTWTYDRADRADLLGKDNWRKYPEGMAKARAISEVIREGGTDALNGVTYTPEELGASVYESGDVIEGAVIDGELVEQEAPPAPSAKPAARKQATKGTQGTRRAAPAAKTPEAATEAPAAAEEPAAPAADPNVEDAVEVPADAEPTAEEIAAAKKAEVSANVAAARAEVAAKRAADKAAGQAERDAVDAAAMAAPSTKPIDQQAKLDEMAAEREEREERARFAAEQEAAARAESVEEDANPATGELPLDETADETADRIRNERIARGAPVGPVETAEAVVAIEEPWGEPEPEAEASDYEFVTKAEPTNWVARLEAATTLEQVKAVWDDANAADGAMATETRLAVVKHKARVIELQGA